MRNVNLMALGLCLCGLLVGGVHAETFELTDGQTVTGDIVSFNESGLILRLGEGKYSERISWTKFSQADLKKMQKKPKIAPLVEPFIEIPIETRVKKTDPGEIKLPERLKRPPKGSLIGAIFTSSVGLVSLLLIYLANVYAAYEISIVRAYPPGLVCGISAVAPFIGPIIFLCMPTKIASAETWKPGQPRPAAAAAVEAAPEPMADAEGGMAYPPPEEAAPAAPVLPPTQTFQRGKFTFNRRFFETKFPGFFGLVRRDPEKDMVLVFKSARGEYVANRITRIAANDLHIEVRKGVASQEVVINYTEIHEVQLKHKDA